MPEALGVVAGLARFPVKSMQGEDVRTAVVTPAGFLGDRAYALVERSTGRVLTAKHPRIGSKLLACSARFTASFGAGDPLPPVEISLPGGRVATSADGEAEAAMCAFLGMDVSLERSAPVDFTIEVAVPDLEEPGSEGRGDAVEHGKVGAAGFKEMGMESPVPPGSFLDAFPVSLLSTSTLALLSTLAPESTFDARRFRMNVIVTSPEEGFVEQQWLGRTLSVGNHVRLAVTIPDPRCVMTTVAQGDLPRDTGVLRALSVHSRLEVLGSRLPCAGVYAVVESTGTVRKGDSLSFRAARTAAGLD